MRKAQYNLTRLQIYYVFLEHNQYILDLQGCLKKASARRKFKKIGQRLPYLDNQANYYEKIYYKYMSQQSYAKYAFKPIVNKDLIKNQFPKIVQFRQEEFQLQNDKNISILDQVLTQSNFDEMIQKEKENMEKANNSGPILIQQQDIQKEEKKNKYKMFRLCQIINSGVMHYQQPIGCYFQKMQDYQNYKKLSNPILQRYHKFDYEKQHQVNELSQIQINQDFTEASQSIIIEARVNIFRNLKGVPLNSMCGYQKQKKIYEIIKQNFGVYDGYKHFDLEEMRLNPFLKSTLVKRRKLQELGIFFQGTNKYEIAGGIHRNFLKGARSISVDIVKNSYILVNESEHFKFGCVLLSQQEKVNMKQIVTNLVNLEKKVRIKLSRSKFLRDQIEKFNNKQNKTNKNSEQVSQFLQQQQTQDLQQQQNQEFQKQNQFQQALQEELNQIEQMINTSEDNISNDLNQQKIQYDKEVFLMHKKLGYITCDPKRLGCAFQASVVIQMSKLTKIFYKIKKQLVQEQNGQFYQENFNKQFKSGSTSQLDFMEKHVKSGITSEDDLFSMEKQKIGNSKIEIIQKQDMFIQENPLQQQQLQKQMTNITLSQKQSQQNIKMVEKTTGHNTNVNTQTQIKSNFHSKQNSQNFDTPDRKSNNKKVFPLVDPGSNSEKIFQEEDESDNVGYIVNNVDIQFLHYEVFSYIQKTAQKFDCTAEICYSKQSDRTYITPNIRICSNESTLGKNEQDILDKIISCVNYISAVNKGDPVKYGQKIDLLTNTKIDLLQNNHITNEQFSQKLPRFKNKRLQKNINNQHDENRSDIIENSEIDTDSNCGLFSDNDSDVLEQEEIEQNEEIPKIEKIRYKLLKKQPKTEDIILNRNQQQLVDFLEDSQLKTQEEAAQDEYLFSCINLSEPQQDEFDGLYCKMYTNIIDTKTSKNVKYGLSCYKEFEYEYSSRFNYNLVMFHKQCIQRWYFEGIQNNQYYLKCIDKNDNFQNWYLSIVPYQKQKQQQQSNLKNNFDNFNYQSINTQKSKNLQNNKKKFQLYDSYAKLPDVDSIPLNYRLVVQPDKDYAGIWNIVKNANPNGYSLQYIGQQFPELYGQFIVFNKNGGQRTIDSYWGQIKTGQEENQSKSQIVEFYIQPNLDSIEDLIKAQLDQE